ncbi:MAG: rhodanese-like domain-containing protein [Chloroflexi bacterium]|nr:rhodanese-like domain-containing protein [Chloroflexota bacterium]MBI3167811.1 rhodanese-like domain-containing protein [Chloroflexota bacterium]
MSQSGLGSFLRKPAGQVTAIAIVALIVYLIAASAGGGASSAVATEISVDQAYEKYQAGTFVLDVRSQEEWDEYHAPNTTLIPLDELPSRLNELPKDKEIVVVCRSGNRSQQGRDILLNAGFNATSMAGGLKEWYAKGYPTEGQPVQ